jgi:NAD(P)-dependent dehydrogenase (short-subunit alcohol dehydrogenase family)
VADAAFGGVDVLVNNAGIMRLASLADSDDALLDSHVAINLKGSFNALREASRRLRNRGAEAESCSPRQSTGSTWQVPLCRSISKNARPARIT